MPRKNVSTKKVKEAVAAVEAAATPSARRAAVDRLKTATDELSLMAREAKKRYDSLDTQTKKQVVAGIAGAAALLAAAIGTGVAKKNRRT